MQRYRLIILAILISVSTTSRSAAGDRSCQLNRLVKLPIHIRSDNTYSVDANINGMPAEMKIYTSITPSGLYPASISRLKLETRKSLNEFLLPANSKDDLVAYAKKFELGGTDFGSAELWDLPFNPDISEDGIVAAGILSKFDIEIDPENKTISMYSQDHCPGKVVYWAPSYSVTPFSKDDLELPVEINGHSFSGFVEYGEAQTGISWRMAQSVFDINPDSPGVEKIKDVSKPYRTFLPISTYKFQELKFGELTVYNPTLKISDKSGYQRKSGDVILGMNILSHLHVFIAYSEHKFYYTVNSR